MANPSQGSQAAGAAGGTRGAHQSMVVLFERDESLAGLVLGQLRGLGYECRPARTPVEVFDSIARYPVGLVLVNLGQAATGRREFWVALDSQRRGRGVQVLTYRQVIPGVEPEPDSSGRTPLADVEMRGPQGYLALVEMVRARLAPPARQAAESDFLLSGPMRAQPPKGQPPAPAPAPIPPKLEAAVPQQIAGVLNLHAGPYAGQPPDFSPLPAGQNGATNGRAMGAWTPEMPGGWTMTPATLQAAPEPPDTRSRQWPGERPPDDPPTQMAPGRSALPPLEPPAAKAERTAPANDPGGGGPPRPPDGMSLANGASVPRSGPPVPPTMPMGDLAGLTDAINALAAAGAPGYHNAVAAAQAVNAASMPNNGETPRWAREYAPPAQEVRGYPAPNQDGSMMNNQGMGDAPRYSPPAQANGARQPSGPMAAGNQPNNGQRPGAAENLYADQHAFAEMRQTQEPPRPQPSQSRSLGDTLDEFEQFRRERAAQQRGPGEEPPSLAWRPSGGNMAPLNPPPGYQNQHLAAVALPGHVERALGNVLVEGQLVSQQRLEVALGIQRLLRGADIDYRLGELLLLFKFLTPDQLLAALLVSRGLVTPTQVAAMGRIKQELHIIGMEYDLENLLILFRLLSSEQLREIRSEFP